MTRGKEMDEILVIVVGNFHSLSRVTGDVRQYRGGKRKK